jgi:dihydropyrimidinase
VHAVTFDLVVRGGRVVTAHDDYPADVGVTDGRIAAIGSGLRGSRELDASGRLVIPGAIDGHVHMRTERPAAVYDDDWDTGTIAAAFGGVTTIIDQAQVEPGSTLAEGVERRLAAAAGKAVVDYGLHVNLREPNRERIAEFEQLAARGMPSFKFYMTYDTYKVPDDVLFVGMQEIARLGGLAIVHAENDVMITELERQNAAAGRSGPRANAAARPPELEAEAVHRCLAMARVAGARTLIFHVSAADAVRELAAAKARGQAVFGEAVLAYLMLTIDAADEPVSGTALDIGPPLRDEAHRLSLWDGLRRGALDIISTDHGPRRRVRTGDGTLRTPPGTSGVEVRLPLAYTFGVRAGRLSLRRWVDVCCTRPAEIFGLTRKGRILPGYDADLVVFDPERRVTLSHTNLHSNIDHSTYEGVEVVGYPVVTIGRGEVLVRDGALQVAPGRGRFVERAYPAPHSPL